jgi:ubiquitin carboxyl-terminal hydrolase 5/13
VDESAVEQLMSMGFPRNRCVRALIKTGNNGPDVAMNWLFEHMDDPDIDDPIDTAADSGGMSDVSEAQLQGLMDMGFTLAQAKKAMSKTVYSYSSYPFHFV